MAFKMEMNVIVETIIHFSCQHIHQVVIYDAAGINNNFVVIVGASTFIKMIKLNK